MEKKNPLRKNRKKTTSPFLPPEVVLSLTVSTYPIKTKIKKELTPYFVHYSLPVAILNFSTLIRTDCIHCRSLWLLFINASSFHHIITILKLFQDKGPWADWSTFPCSSLRTLKMPGFLVLIVLWYRWVTEKSAMWQKIDICLFYCQWWRSMSSWNELLQTGYMI